MRGEPRPEKDHAHECPHCELRYGCAFTGCRGDGWAWKVCAGCYQIKHQKRTKNGAESDTAAVVKGEE